MLPLSGLSFSALTLDQGKEGDPQHCISTSLLLHRPHQSSSPQGFSCLWIAGELVMIVDS